MVVAVKAVVPSNITTKAVSDDDGTNESFMIVFGRELLRRKNTACCWGVVMLRR